MGLCYDCTIVLPFIYYWSMMEPSYIWPPKSLHGEPQRHTHMSFPNPTDQRTSNKNTEPCATESKSFACLHGCHGVQSVFRGRSSSLLLPQIPIDHNIIIIIAIEKRHRGEYAPPQMIVMMEMVVFLLVGGSASNLCCSYHFTVAVASIRPSVRSVSDVFIFFNVFSVQMNNLN